ncbi:hypothetical protein EXE42_14440 [Halorubrum sp. SP3]|nr:hypothetical protein EXE42_14440 [Halorubrum sp. SP3]
MELFTAVQRSVIYKRATGVSEVFAVDPVSTIYKQAAWAVEGATAASAVFKQIYWVLIAFDLGTGRKYERSVHTPAPYPKIDRI